MTESPIHFQAFKIEGLGAEQTLACEEALLNRSEQNHGPNLLWFWEPRAFFVVAGFSRPLEEDVDLEACRAMRIPVLRRCSGGGTVLQGPGCLNYGLVLEITPGSPWRTIVKANASIMQCHRQSIENLLQIPVQIHGVTDLTLGNRKFSGNAQRRRHHFLLFHGCFMLDLDLAVVTKVLRLPKQQPPYRQGRMHEDFLVNLHQPAQAIQNALLQSWAGLSMDLPRAPIVPPAGFGPCESSKLLRPETCCAPEDSRALDCFTKNGALPINLDLPWARIDELVRTQYAKPEWIHRV